MDDGREVGKGKEVSKFEGVGLVVVVRRVMVEVVVKRVRVVVRVVRRVVVVSVGGERWKSVVKVGW